MDPNQGNSGGTGDAAATAESGSQSQQVAGQQATGVDGAKAQEPTVEVNGRQVPVSQVELALKNNESYTKLHQEIADRRRALEAREAELSQRELANSPVDALATALQDPEIGGRMAQVAPDLAQIIPSPERVSETRYAAENLRLKFDAFARENPQFEEDELAGIRQEAVVLARRGDFDGAEDFETIGLRLYRDKVLERERTRAVQEAQANEQQRQQAAAQSGVLGAGMAQVTSPVDMSKLSPEQKIALGHAQRAQRK